MKKEIVDSILTVGGVGLVMVGGTTIGSGVALHVFPLFQYGLALSAGGMGIALTPVDAYWLHRGREWINGRRSRLTITQQ